MSTPTTTTINNSEILWKLIQGQQAIDWAKTKVGWNAGFGSSSTPIPTNDNGTCVCVCVF